MCSIVCIKETSNIVIFVIVFVLAFSNQPIMGNPHDCFQEMGWLVGFALLFRLDLIFLVLDARVLSCIARDPSAAWYSWKTWKLHSWGHINPTEVQKVAEKKEKLVKKFPVYRVFLLDWLWEYHFSTWELQEHFWSRYITWECLAINCKLWKVST